MLLTRRISWHMAHRIYGYDGLCGTLHGHTYSAEISLAGPVEDRSGMVCDFGELKNLLVNVIDGWFDHSVFLWEGDPLLQAVRPYSSRMVVLSGPATAENLARVIFCILDRRTKDLLLRNAPMPCQGVERHVREEMRISRIRLWETEKSSVEIDCVDESVRLVEVTVGGQLFSPV